MSSILNMMNPQETYGRWITCVSEYDLLVSQNAMSKRGCTEPSIWGYAKFKI